MKLAPELTAVIAEADEVVVAVGAAAVVVDMVAAVVADVSINNPVPSKN